MAQRPSGAIPSPGIISYSLCSSEAAKKYNLMVRGIINQKSSAARGRRNGGVLLGPIGRLSRQAEPEGSYE